MPLERFHPDMLNPEHDHDEDRDRAYLESLDNQTREEADPDDPEVCGCTADIECDRHFQRTLAHIDRAKKAKNHQAYTVTGEPLTVAVRVCGTCKQLIGVDLWTGSDAHAEAWCETAGLCAKCFKSMEDEALAREKALHLDYAKHSWGK